MNIAALLQRLESASFSERESLADALAGRLDENDRLALVPSLSNGKPAIRLGLIEILARSGDPAMVAPLLAHARSQKGDDRIFALRGLCRLAQPGDETLQGAALEFSASPDPFTQAQAQALLKVLGLMSPSVKEPSRSLRPTQPVDSTMVVGNLQALNRTIRTQTIELALAMDDQGNALLLRALLETPTDGPRLDLVAALEGLPRERFVVAAGEALAKGNGDVVALVARALIRQSLNLSSDARAGLRPLLENARRRLAHSPLASAALDDALIDVADADLPSDLWAQLVDADVDRLASQVDRWLGLSAAELALRAPVLIAAVKKRFERWAIVGAALELAAPALRPSVRVDLRSACRQAMSLLPSDATRDIVAALAQVLAQVAVPGDPLPGPLFAAADRLSDAEILCDLCRLCLRLASEEAALRLLDLAKDPLPEVATEATSAIQQFNSPFARVVHDEQGDRVVTSYRTAQGKELSTAANRLFDPENNNDYALDDTGHPVAVKDIPFGACRCCPRPHVLVRQGKDGLHCPSTRFCYLHDKGQVVLATDHPLGRCSRCESISARVREGAYVVCPDCGAGRPGAAVVSGSNPSFPEEIPSLPNETRKDLPHPPSREELRLVAPHIRHAMAANIFVVADARTGGWTGSGIIVAREGNDVAILTNRHMVEDQRANEVPNMRALSLGGEVVPLTLLWRAQGGVDLALVEARFENPDSIDVMDLGQGACMVGSPLFSIGNPLDLAWTYTSGTLSAIRHWETPEKIAVRLIQTDVPTGPGSSGGGLFHQEGHLVGIISFGKQGDHGDAAHFAISVPTIRETMSREQVRWRNQALEKYLG
jgi:S1-C subfamily serine protease